MRRLFVFIFVLSFTLVSCEKLLLPDPPSATPTLVFESLWKTLDKGYINFAYKNVDWDSVYKVYKPKIVDTMPEQALYDTCALMLKALKDPNINLKSPFAESSFPDTTTYKANFNRYLLQRNYWQDIEKTGPFLHTTIDSIGYVYYESMDEEVTNAQLDIIIEKLRLKNDSIQGVIFDIRDNKGGDINNVFTLMKRMGIDTSYKLSAIMYKSYYKKGPKHDDITEAQTAYIEQIDKTKFPKHFVLLTNRRTRAEAALFAAAATGYNNVVTMGDRTGGGAGRIVGDELLNGWQVSYPASYFTTDDDRYIEDGVKPMKHVDMDPADEAKGKDSILEAALTYISHL